MTIVIRKRTESRLACVYAKEKAGENLDEEGGPGNTGGETVIIDDDWQRSHRRR